MHIYEGTLEAILNLHGDEIRGRHVKLIIESQFIALEKEVEVNRMAAAEWVRSLQKWASSHDKLSEPLSVEAIDQDSIYFR